MRKIELLSPAKDLECGIQAINHGADAVYIGAPRFSARSAAGNSISDIKKLTDYAHKYFARVYVALNTILDDSELEEAQNVINQIYEAEADALIIQDFGILKLNLPPIALHASTQMDNRTPEKVKFLEDVGFSQVVLARELSFEKIREIAEKTNVCLEAFIHGALCVSYSGQCYLSQAFCGRSANRGNCAQFCRLPYTLTDADGKVIVKDKYLLSLQDFNLSSELRNLINAGASSLKIEGRLKDVAYVKNVTAFYRKKLDEILDEKEFVRSSSGKSIYTFEPNLEKSFHRGGCTYFTKGRNKNITAWDTPKSTGEFVGIVKSSNGKSIVVETDKVLNNGDGFCFFDNDNNFSGFKVNRVEHNTIYPQNRVDIVSGTKLYRNFDQSFERILSKESAERTIDVSINVKFENENIILSAKDEDNIEASISKLYQKQIAKNPENALAQLKMQLSKTGGTIFRVEMVTIESDEVYFCPNSLVAEWRRELINELESKRNVYFMGRKCCISEKKCDFIESNLDYRANIHNNKAGEFYKEHGVLSLERSYESKRLENVELMRCKYCIKYCLGLCPKQENTKKYKEPFYLQNNQSWKVMLKFDCKCCEMVLIG